MATKKVVTVANAADEIAGLFVVRSERLRVARGVIKTTDYAVGDTIVIEGIPAKKILHARVVNAAGTAGIEYVAGAAAPGTIELELSGAVVEELRYFVEFEYGSGVETLSLHVVAAA